MQFANSPHLEAKKVVWLSNHLSDLPTRVETLACMLPAFRMKYAALGSNFLASRPRSNTRKIQLRTPGAVSGRPRRLASANHEPPDPAEETPEEKSGSRLEVVDAPSH